MRLIMFTVVAASVAGLVAGGTFRDFPSTRLRSTWLALAGVVLQFIPVGGTLGTILLYASFAALIAFGVLNIRAPGFVLILIGLALNAIVIVANQGMPVTRNALERSNQSATLSGSDRERRREAPSGRRRHDPPPAGGRHPAGAAVDQAISVGDVCVQLGAAWFIVFSMPRRHPRLVSTKAAA